MEKIKQILKPGHKQDEEILYGDKESRLREGRENPTQDTAAVAPATSTSDGEPGGILSQITNPGGKKYDERRFDTSPTATTGTTGAMGTSAAGTTAPRVVDGGDASSVLSIKSGIKGPFAGETDGEVAGTTSTSQALPDRTAATAASDIGRDSPTLGTGAAAGTGTSVLDRSHPLRDVTGSDVHHINPVGAPSVHPTSEADPNIVSTYGTSSTDRRVDGQASSASAPISSKVTGADSSLGNREAVAIGSVGAAGLVGGAAASHHQGSGAGSATTPATIGLNSSIDNSNFGRDTGAVGAAGLAGTGAGAATTHSGTQSGLGHSHSVNHPRGQSVDCDGKPVPGYVHHTSGPHSTDIANQLDPEVAAGPPLAPYTGSGQHTHGAQSGTGSHLGRDATVVGGAGAVGAGAYSATRDNNTTTTHGSTVDNTLTSASRHHRAPETNTGTQSHLGRDAAVIGGAGAVGTGAYAATRDDNATTATHGSTLGQSPASTAGAHQTPGVQNGTDSHLGRNAAVVGGASAAGAGTYAATKDTSSTAAHGSTIGQTPASTAGTAQAQGAQAGTASHLGRDTAVVGGAGALGAGAYAATRDQNTSTATHGSAVGQAPASYGGTNPALNAQHNAGLAHTSTTYGGTHPEIDRKHEGATGGHTTYGGTHPEIDRKHQAAGAGAAGVGAAGVYGGGSALADDKHERRLQQAREDEAEKGGDHGEKKPSLIQKILHPGSHGKDKDHEDKKHDSEHKERHHDQVRAEKEVHDNSRLSSEGHREHGHVKTTVDEKGHTKLHKDPPPSHPAAQASSAGVAGPDWDAVNQANRTS